MPEEIKRAFLRDSMTLKAFFGRVVVVHGHADMILAHLMVS